MTVQKPKFPVCVFDKKAFLCFEFVEACGSYTLKRRRQLNR